MPAESDTHARTLMSWPPRQSHWTDYGPAVQEDVARIARAVAEHEPVTMVASPDEVEAATRACGAGVEVVPVATDDLWMRDTGPTMVVGPDGLAGINFHFNGWGGKQKNEFDAKVASSLLDHKGITRIDAPIVAEGGSLEADGAGTFMATESSLVNPNRNPGKSRNDIERALQDLLGVTTVIWFEGVRGHDITDAHVDGLARFVEPGVVLLGKPAGDDPIATRLYNQAREVLEGATDARGKQFELVDLPEVATNELGKRGEMFFGGYANYYVINGAVLVPTFNAPKSDANAASIIAELHPGRTIVQIDINAIAEGGGGIHCATQQQPAV